MKTSFLTASKVNFLPFLRYKIDPKNQNLFELRNRAVKEQRKMQWDPELKVKKQRHIISLIQTLLHDNGFLPNTLKTLFTLSSLLLDL